MTRSYSTDLRVRVIRSISDGLSRRRAAARFGVGVLTTVSWYRRYRETGEVSARVGELGANIVEVGHERWYYDVPIRMTEGDFLIETRDGDHARAVLDGLGGSGNFRPPPQQERA